MKTRLRSHWCPSTSSQQRRQARRWTAREPRFLTGTLGILLKSQQSLYSMEKQVLTLKTKNTASRTSKAHSTPQIGKRVKSEPKKPNSGKNNKRHRNGAAARSKLFCNFRLHAIQFRGSKHRWTNQSAFIFVACDVLGNLQKAASRVRILSTRGKTVV